MRIGRRRQFVDPTKLCATALGISLAWSASHSVASNPTSIFVWDINGSFEQQAMMASLMGNVNKTSPEMFMAHQNSQAFSNPKFWLDQYVATQPATQVNWSNSPATFFGFFANRVNGYIRYDSRDELNVATSLSGVLGAVVVNADNEHWATSAGLTMIEDVRGRDTTWAVANYGSHFNKNKVISLDPNLHAHPLRDYAALHNVLTYWDPPNKDAILAGQNDHTQVYGWDAGDGAQGEFEFFSSASENNLKAVAANFSQGYSGLSQWSVDVPGQATHVPTNTPTTDGKHYVAFVMSDGDNAQWLTNGFANDPKWFGSPHRGNFTMNWDLTPEMLSLSPITLKYLYENASTGENKDFFVTAHGPGTDYPSEVPDWQGSLAATSASMQSVDQNILSILDNVWDTSTFDTILNDPAIDGAMFKSNWGCAYACQGGQIYWHNGKPVVSVKHSLWDGFGTASSVASALNSAPTSPLTNQSSYSVVNVHPWSTGGLGDPMSNLNDLVGQLDGNVEDVTFEELILHLRNNFGTPGGPVGPTELVTNGDFEVGITDWVTAANGFENIYVGDDGSSGTQSAGFDTNTFADIGNPATWADWRSSGFDVKPGDKLRWSFLFKIANGSDGEILAELRGFTDSSQATFDEEDIVILSDTDGEWVRVVRDYTVPAGSNYMDLRFNNIFTNVLDPFRGSFRLDDVSVLLFSEILDGDFDRSGTVDQADYDYWKQTFGSTHDLSADGNRNGIIDGGDYAIWLANLGTSLSQPNTSARNVPEPNSLCLLLLLGVILQAYLRRGLFR